MNSAQIKAEYDSRRNEKTDINEHLDALADLATECVSIIEFGTRSGNSTVALLHGLACRPDGAGRLETVDIDERASAYVQGILDPGSLGRVGWTEVPNDPKDPSKGQKLVGGAGFRAVTADSLGIRLTYEPDMIFIDSLHTYSHLKQELALHGNKAKKFLVFHDTVTFGMAGEDGTSPGLMDAIREFMDANQHWDVRDLYDHNNGLTVLERKVEAPASGTPKSTHWSGNVEALQQEGVDRQRGAATAYLTESLGISPTAPGRSGVGTALLTDCEQVTTAPVIAPTPASRFWDPNAPDASAFYGLDQLHEAGFSYSVGFVGAEVQLVVREAEIAFQAAAPTIREALEKIKATAKQKKAFVDAVVNLP